MAATSDLSGNLSLPSDDLPTSPHHPPSQQQPSTPPAVQIPSMALPYLPPSSSSSNPRRLPPPCWSHDETVALIDAYRDKWYSLRRGNLKASHWQDVADAVLSRCPAAPPPHKTPVQCRHKMEKLRKRYRAELQRARSRPPPSRLISSWVHFARMDSMEKGPSAVKAEREHEDKDEEDEEEEDDEDGDHMERGGWTEQQRKGGAGVRSGSYYSNGIGVDAHAHSSLGSKPRLAQGVCRVKIPTTKAGVSIAERVLPGFNLKPHRKFSSGDANPGISDPRARARARASADASHGGVERAERDRDAGEEMVGAIKMLGDGFVRMEEMKMEMAREIEGMRMEMEMKRTEMILESQQRIIEAFAEAVSDRKRKVAQAGGR